MLRRRLQSVTGSLAEFLPVVSSLIGFGPPGRYDVPFAGIAISVDDRHLNAIHKSDSANSHLAIVETIVYPLNRGAVEYSCSILKRNPVPTDVGSVLVGVPGESHS
jgi:hypothetical protein